MDFPALYLKNSINKTCLKAEANRTQPEKIMQKVIITGATGMVGKGVLLECLDHGSIEEVLAIGRNSPGICHPKLKELIVKDFTDFTSIANQLQGYDGCFFCMGINATGLKEEEYKRITYDSTLSLAKSLVTINPGMTFNYVSGQGTDSTEKGSMMWARVKGKAENGFGGLKVSR